MNYNASGVRNRFKTAEGRFVLHAERTTGLQPFNYQRSPRLTLAQLQGGAEEGAWILFNIGECLNIARYDATHKDPSKALLFNSSPVRTGYPTCHAYAPARDGLDLLVGLGDGSVLLLSLRAHLQAAGISVKPNPAVSLAPETVSEVHRCTALAWVPRSDAGVFAAAFSSGNIYVYKKSHLTGEGSGKFSLSLGSGNKSQAPSSTIQLTGGGVNDIAVSPDGRLLAAACRDGALRLVDLGSGGVVGGFCSYYGALLCCAFSPCGKFVATGGEDDLVSVYGVAERSPVVYGEGHRSWVSRVAWDPWAFHDASGGASRPRTALPEPLAGPPPRLYRLGSAGQDCELCMWDVQPGGDGEGLAGLMAAASLGPGAGGGMKRNGSVGALAAAGGSRPSDGSPVAGSGPGHDRKSSVGKGGGLCPSLPRADMYIIQPVMEHKIHLEPMSDLLYTEEAIFTVDHTGNIRTWVRPQPEAGA
ncbi:hypothetical protein HYH03_006309 [Edaphochlamys debaryana]|uniref:Uncharacterized protein n=1 Tax=Edaphochlamys debaryana TaxID=47281 RepID=A0A835YDR8_9CHLO|nr:hypothetical protein HYH03_006309 [Edaphochlamys debaryana]|eukprot:KAG2495709.1 hypothetical protein HYH03_006309 [Edaphochlamys debaryana]